MKKDIIKVFKSQINDCNASIIDNNQEILYIKKDTAALEKQIEEKNKILKCIEDMDEKSLNNIKYDFNITEEFLSSDISKSTHFIIKYDDYENIVYYLYFHLKIGDKKLKVYTKYQERLSIGNKLLPITDNIDSKLLQKINEKYLVIAKEFFEKFLQTSYNTLDERSEFYNEYLELKKMRIFK